MTPEVPPQPPPTEAQHVARTEAVESSRVTQVAEGAAAVVSAGQRRVNLIWEVTQALIALGVTFSTLLVSALLSVRGNADTAAFLLMSNAFFLVVGFYFGRTNHQRTGGVGPNEYGR